MPSPVTEASVGTTRRLARGEISDVRPKTSIETGAVPRVAATETARSARTESGKRCRSRSRGRTSASIPAKAENDSWNPTSNTENGFMTNTTKAANASPCH